MSEIKLFQIGPKGATELKADAPAVEKSLQALVERSCETILGVSFLASEYSTGKTHAGRIDTLGLDEDGCPVIVEYKRTTNENVINQGLFYLDWLLDHKAEFERLVSGKLGKERSDAIDWASPRLICIAGDFTRYDEHAVQQIDRNIDLFRYKRFGADLLALQLVHRRTDSAISEPVPDTPARSAKSRPSGDKAVQQALLDADEQTKDLFTAFSTLAKALGDDVQEKMVKLYMTFRRIKTFACVVVKKHGLIVYLKVDPTQIQLEQGFTRDVREIGHWGTGDLEVALKTPGDLKKIEPLLVQSYENS